MSDEQLTTWQWLASDEGLAAIDTMPLSPTTADIAALRKTMSAEQVRAASDAKRARVKGAKKLDAEFAQRMISDLPGIEMASSARSSLYKAQRFAKLLSQGSRVTDLCCGIGGDSWGLDKAGLTPIGVDRSPVRAWMYQYNTGFDVVCGDAWDDCPQADAFHLDPARRTNSGTRTLEIEDFQPGPAVWDQLIERFASGAIKLNPGVHADVLPEGELEIISEIGGLTQGILWVGNLAGEYDRRATKLMGDGSVSTIAGEPWRPEDSAPIGQYLGTLDPCLERADLVGELLELTGTQLVHPGTGMVTYEQAVEHPMIRWHRVHETIGWNRKRVKAALRKLDGGIVEVRTRGGVINPDDEQRALKGKGTNDRLTVFIYRIDQKLTTVIAERLTPSKTPHTHEHVWGERKG